VLSFSERTELAADLIESLPPILDDEDKGVTEALRRDEEMERDASASITRELLCRGSS
jgi:hypothetical protein